MRRTVCNTLLFIAAVLAIASESPASAQSSGTGQRALIPMDALQRDHLRAYGVVYRAIETQSRAMWLLNYRGGSFLLDASGDVLRDASEQNVSVELLSAGQAEQILEQIDREDVNMSVVNLEKTPRIAVYSPPGAVPWDDAVKLALDYAQVPYDIVYDREILSDSLSRYDWLHLHHEDFTGQFGKFWVNYRSTPWYIRNVQMQETLARELGFDKVRDLKLQVAVRIRDYIAGGGFLFAMCSGTDTFDIALAAQGLDIVDTPFDRDPPDPGVSSRLDFSSTLAFENFSVITDPQIYEHSDIDVPVDLNRISQSLDYFTLFQFSAKWDPVPSMLTQNHVSSIPGFYGQATAFQKDKVKPSVVVLGETPGRSQVKYLHGNHGLGTFTFYAGHDPEDYTHRVNDPPTDLALHPNSPGYRLILNNILFPAAKKEKRKT